MLDALTTLLEAGAAAPWVLAVVLLIAVGDALFPPVPSEGVVVALAAVAVAGHGPHLPLLALAAAVGAFLGDSLTFVVGRRYGPQRLARVDTPARPAPAGARVRHPGAPRRPGRAHRPLRAARPGRREPHRRRHRLPAASLRRPRRARRRDLGRLVGGRRALAGHWLDGNPLLGSGAGIALALGLGLAVDRVARRVTGWGRMPGAAASAARPVRAVAVAGHATARPSRRALTAPRRLPTGRPAVCTLHPRVPIMALALST